MKTGPCKLCNQYSKLQGGVCQACSYIESDADVQQNDFSFSWGLAMEEEPRMELEIEIEALNHAIDSQFCGLYYDVLKRILDRKNREYKRKYG